jgi:CubicO group peptidase (beta-lactamase class C family)
MPDRDTPDPLARAVDATIAAYLADGSVPGVALAITGRDGLLLARTGGFAEVASRTPVHAETLFEIGSIGKSFTAHVILQLADEGRLAVDDPVVRHLPWFRVPRTGERITIHHLLSHTAGITAGIDGTPEATMQVHRLRDLRPGSAPGRRFHYSNVGYKALGLVIEAIEGASYPSVIRRRVMDPAGMSGSEPAISNAIRARVAVGYQPAIDDAPWQDGEPLAPSPWLETDTADGSVAATGTDMAAYLRWLMADLEAGGPVARMATPVPALGGFGYGYGLLRFSRDGREYRGHGGGMVGFISGMTWDQAAGVGAVVLQNGPGGAPTFLSRQLVRQAVATLEGRDPAVEPVEPAPSDDDGEDAAETTVGTTGPTAEQTVIAGTYRSHDPWEPVFRVEARSDELWLVFPSAPDGFDDEQVLRPMAGGWWRVGDDRLGPERMRFDTVIDGRARRAWLSGWPSFRVDP